MTNTEVRNDGQLSGEGRHGRHGARMRKVQLVRGRVKPQAHQVITIHQTTKAERVAQIPRESFWTTAPREGFTAYASQQAFTDGRSLKGKKAVVPPQHGVLARPESSETRPCAVCGKPMVLKLRGPQKQYCSHACGQKAWKRARRQRAA